MAQSQAPNPPIPPAERVFSAWATAPLALKSTVAGMAPKLAVALNDLEEEFDARPLPSREGGPANT